MKRPRLPGQVRLTFVTRCTTVSREFHEPLPGTAVTARTWLLLEQPGPWGPKALTGSHLDRRVGHALEAAAKGTGIRIALIRRPGRRADLGAQKQVRQVYAAHTAPGAGWIRSASVTDPRELLGLDLTALERGDHRTFDAALHGVPHTGAPLALLCTNGRRDRCCALLGRPLAADLTTSGAKDVWEVSHLGGHRFAPTVLVLPYGYMYGQVEAHTVKEILHRAGEGHVVLDQCRGRTTWDRPAQAAELAVRKITREYAADALHVVRTDGAAPRWTVTVVHADRRAWRVTVAQGTCLPPRPESCGSAPLTPTRMDVVEVREITMPTTLVG